MSGIDTPNQIAYEGYPRHGYASFLSPLDGVGEDLVDLHRPPGQQVLRHRRVTLDHAGLGRTRARREERKNVVLGQIQIGTDAETSVIADGYPDRVGDGGGLPD